MTNSTSAAPTARDNLLIHCAGEADRAVRAVAAAGGFAALSEEHREELVGRIRVREMREAANRRTAASMVALRAKALEAAVMLEASGEPLEPGLDRTPWTFDQCLDAIRRNDAARLRERLRREEGLAPDAPSER